MYHSNLAAGLSISRFTSNHTGLSAVLLFLILLLSGSELVSGQSGPRNDPYNNNARLSPALAVVVVVVIALLFLIGFFTVYISHFTGATEASVNAGAGPRRATNVSVTARGLNASLIESFPTFVYSDVKSQKIGKGALECAICLNEFEDDETLRLLPKCDHVFHPHCIGAWLKGHVTCPVCRTNLAVNKPDEPIEPELIAESDMEAQQEPVAELGESVARGNFTRSHTTGHSVVLHGECTERFTLKVPDDLRKKIMSNWKMNRSNSLLAIQSGGSDKPVNRSRAKSDRWLFLKTSDDGSVRVGANAVTSPTGDSVRADRWTFLRNPSFLWRNTPKDGNCKDGEGTSTGKAGSPTGSVRLPV
ncbi:unnamed protein product [Cochlearia groenlandica]